MMRSLCKVIFIAAFTFIGHISWCLCGTPYYRSHAFQFFNEENRECTMAQSISSDFYFCIFLLILFHVDWRLQKIP